MFGAVTLAATIATAPAAALGASGLLHPAAVLRPDTLRMVLVVEDTAAHSSLIRGVTLGAEEAAHTGVLFAQPVTLAIIDAAAFDRAEHSSAHTPRSTPSIYIVAGDSSFCSRFMRQSERQKIPVLEAGCPRTNVVTGTTYSIDSRSSAADAPDSASLALWHASLERFGAEQLNQRFRRRFDRAMDSDAWAGWFATKVALDLALHAHSVSPPALLGQLADPRASFDGQKGRPLRFAPDTHRLIQPLYRVAGVGDSSRVVSEVAP